MRTGERINTCPIERDGPEQVFRRDAGHHELLQEPADLPRFHIARTNTIEIDACWTGTGKGKGKKGNGKGSKGKRQNKWRNAFRFFGQVLPMWRLRTLFHNALRPRHRQSLVCRVCKPTMVVYTYVLQASVQESMRVRAGIMDMQGNFNLRNWESNSGANLHVVRLVDCQCLAGLLIKKQRRVSAATSASVSSWPPYDSCCRRCRTVRS